LSTCIPTPSLHARVCEESQDNSSWIPSLRLPRLTFVSSNHRFHFVVPFLLRADSRTHLAVSQIEDRINSYHQKFRQCAGSKDSSYCYPAFSSAP
jgi:hypothetical protein